MPGEPPATAQRIVALDAFRGLTIAAMIVVNNPGSWSHVYAPLRHAQWHGWTPTDLVFPFFLFIVGTASAFALGKRPANRTTVGRILRRTVVLFGLGLFLAGYPFVTLEPHLQLRPALASIRIPGVLQRIAVCYCATALLVLFARPRTRVAVALFCLLGYQAALHWIPVPGHGAGQIDVPDATVVAWLDRLLLGDHLWSQSRTWDPEGILSTVPALATCLLGASAGRLLRGPGAPTEKTARLLVRGAVLVVVGYVWDWFLPINKSLWTSSYAVFTAGQAMCALGLCYWATEVRGWRRWAQPFVVYGVNAITVFVASGVLAKTLGLLRVGGGEPETSLRTWLYRELFGNWLQPLHASLAWALCWAVAWYAVLLLMYRRRWILKV